jgi:lysophospholipase L1-like esterase
MRLAVLFVVASALVACSNTSSTPVANPDAAGSGGLAGSASGGRPGSGGGVGTGGASSTGGASTGGTMSTGGAVAVGGAKAMGGALATGGTTPIGGTVTAGGTTGGGVGGTSATGGNIDTGGNSGGTGGGAAGSDAGSDARDSASTDTARDSLASDTPPILSDAPTSDTRPNTNTSISIYVAGDSTVSTYTNSTIHQGGWGQFLQDYFIANAKVVNKAVGGMTARHFIEAGYLDQILAVIKAGDYLLVQFGTNDGNTTATYTLSGSTTAIPYYLAPETDFKTYLTRYVDGANAKGATTIFVTPPPRHSCNAGETGVRNGLAAYATAMKELGPTLGTPVVDSNAMIVAYLANVTCETSGSIFYLVKADGTTDGTHFQENGANVIAGLIAKGTAGISTLDLSLSAYVK